MSQLRALVDLFLFIFMLAAAYLSGVDLDTLM